jgi:hypothetical protein
VIINGDLNCNYESFPIETILNNGYKPAYDYAVVKYTTVKHRKELEAKVEDYIFY